MGVRVYFLTTLVLFQALFNYLFDAKVDLKLQSGESIQLRMQNWNKINASICFNYLQQQFILIGSTMQALSKADKGAAFKVICCLLECTRGTQFDITADERCLKDIGYILNIDKDFK